MTVATRMWRRTPAREALAAGVLLVALASFLAPALGHAVELWSTTEEFSYGFLIVPTSAALVYLQWARLRAIAGPGDRLGLAVAAFAALTYVIAERVGVNAVAGLAISPLLFGIALYLWGRRAALAVAFPCAFLAFGFAGYRGLLDTLGFSLQVATAHGAGWLAQLAGLPVVRDGLVLQLPAFGFVVAEACSGMSSLLSLLAISAVWIYFSEARPIARAVVILAVLPIVLLANVMRVALVLGVADRFGPDVATGFFHGASSLVLFGVAVGCLLALSAAVGCRPRIGR
jgi:exosortase